MPPNQNTSQSDNSDNFFEKDSNDDFSIPFEWPPSRPMINYPNDTELEEDYGIGWDLLKEDPGLLIAPFLFLSVWRN